MAKDYHAEAQMLLSSSAMKKLKISLSPWSVLAGFLLCLLLLWGLTLNLSGQQDISAIDHPPNHRLFGKHFVQSVNKGSAIVAAGTTEGVDIWGFDGELADFTVSGQASLVSNNIEDNEFGTGVWKVRVIGIDVTTGRVIPGEIVEMNGTTPVNTVNSYENPLLELEVFEVGSGGDEFAQPAAAGNITATIAGKSAAVIRTDLDHNEARSTPQKIPLRPDGADVVVVVNYITVQISQLNSNPGGTATVCWLRKRLTEPPMSPINCRTYSTGLPLSDEFDTHIEYFTGDVQLIRVTSTEDILVSVESKADAYANPLFVPFPIP